MTSDVSSNLSDYFNEENNKIEIEVKNMDTKEILSEESLLNQ